MVIRKMKTREVLLALGFWPDEARPDSLSFDFGTLVLESAQVLSLPGGFVVAFCGVQSTSRAIRQYDFKLPCMLESLDRGKALIADYLRNFTPAVPCDWLEEGRALPHLSPWERKRLAYEARPKCLIERDWSRLAAKRLRSLAEVADETAVIEIIFDGRTISFQSLTETIAMRATGDAWEKSAWIYLKSHRFAEAAQRASRLSCDIRQPRDNRQICNSSAGD